MDPSFWLERWQRNEIGFHNTAPHRGLQRWWPRLALPPGSRVFVPLAGKSLDMIWLAAQGGVPQEQLRHHTYVLEQRDRKSTRLNSSH